jgi:hypothetical protein
VHSKLSAAWLLAMCLMPMSLQAQSPSALEEDVLTRSPAEPIPERLSPAFSEPHLQALWAVAATRFSADLARRQGWAGATITPIHTAIVDLESSDSLDLRIRPLSDQRLREHVRLWVDLRRYGRTVKTIELPVRVVPDSSTGVPTDKDIAQAQPGAKVQARLRSGAITIERRATLVDSPLARASVRLRMPLGNIVMAAISSDGHTYDILQEGTNP